MSGGIVGNLVGGWGGDWWQRNRTTGRTMFLVWLGVLLAPLSVAYRLADGPTIWFWLGVFLGFFQLGTFYGPTFATVQELAPSQSRGTVAAFYILMLNLVGVGIGTTMGGFVIDALIERGHDTPYGTTLLAFTIISMFAVPLFWYAGVRFRRDRDAVA